LSGMLAETLEAAAAYPDPGLILDSFHILAVSGVCLD
jgi:hypothetical protein